MGVVGLLLIQGASYGLWTAYTAMQETAGTAVALEVRPLPTNLAPGMWFRSCDLRTEMTVVPRPPPLRHPRIGAILILAGIRIDRRAT